jgi:RimJ/RimL family protein N-acetyltransferase
VLASQHVREQNLGVPDGVIVVRHAELADAEAIGEAHASAWEVAYGALFEPDVLRRAAAIRRSMWNHILETSDFDFAGLLVAEQDAHVVGYSQFGPAGENNEQGEIFGFYLHPAAWGGGAATRLMHASLANLEARSLAPVIVWTHPGAARAQAFYAKSGFSATGRSRVAELGGGLDAPEVEFVRGADSPPSAG